MFMRPWLAWNIIVTNCAKSFNKLLSSLLYQLLFLLCSLFGKTTKKNLYQTDLSEHVTNKKCMLQSYSPDLNFSAPDINAASYCSNISTCRVIATFSTKSCLGFSRGIVLLTTWNGSKQPALFHALRSQPGAVRVRARAQGDFRQVCLVALSYIYSHLFPHLEQGL